MTTVQAPPPSTPPSATPPSAPPAPAGALPAVRPPAPPRRSVPRRIRVITGVTVTALALLFGSLAVGSAAARDGLRVIGRDAGPQVLATAGLYFGLSDMDAQIADALLMGQGYGGRRQEALARYERRRSEANDALMKAFALSGDDPAGRRTVQSVLDGLGRYERLVGQALLLDSQARHPAGAPPEKVVEVYRQATDLMRLVLLPQAYNLTLESGTIVRRTYDDKSLTVPALRVAVIVTGLVALACLVWLQVYLARRFRRVFGLALLAATLATAVALVAGASVLGQDERDLRVAKTQGFDPVLNVARARAISNSMQGDQSRYLLDKVRADTYEHTYLDKAQTVFYLPAGNLDAYHAGVAASRQGYLGLMGDRLGGRAGEQALSAYQAFQRADTGFRALAASGRADDAVAARLGEVRQAFDTYDGALVTLSRGHEAAFRWAVGDGERALDDLWRLLPFAIGGIALLILAGVWPRLKEYR
ncbi:hypothetical protein [Nonomuraea roseoviolacea]|uniref:Secreted protein n=1 Tax=Nonomuraea roseoviolacea subsp. carminata TaxID=160689 RepID=A0ABT1JSN7_9ACTN|nr:hypothetical protein [Nonomuraea roseoviolacea]MCP2344762.1 hypothetical protein [Nonomuraea roseoviolacea subsp. carminata]